MTVAPIVGSIPYPQPRVVERAVSVLSSGGLLAFPTDTYYGLGCDLFDKRAIERIYQLKRYPARTSCRSSARISPRSRATRSSTTQPIACCVARSPGRTFILPATRLVPDLVLRRQRAVGIRIPDSPDALEIVRRLGHPLISTSAATPGGRCSSTRARSKALGHGLDLVLDGGYKPNEPSSVIDLSGAEPQVLRAGKGDVSDLLS